MTGDATGTAAVPGRAGPPPGVRHVLFDADGVLQYQSYASTFELLTPHLADRVDEFLQRASEAELPALEGEGDLLPALALLVAEYGIDMDVEEFYQAIWGRVSIVEESHDLVRALLAAGFGVHLGTNQEPRRAVIMRGLGYDAPVDVSCYSCELGVAKPDPAFFLEAARRIGALPAGILFVDDNAANVDGARAAGLRAEHWHVRDGHDRLRRLLAAHGVVLPEGAGTPAPAPPLPCRQGGGS